MFSVSTEAVCYTGSTQPNVRDLYAQRGNGSEVSDHCFFVVVVVVAIIYI